MGPSHGTGETKGNLALLQHDLQTTRTENSSLQAQLSAMQLDVKKTESAHQEEVARLRAQRDQAQSLQAQHLELTTHLQQAAAAHAVEKAALAPKGLQDRVTGLQ